MLHFLRQKQINRQCGHFRRTLCSKRMELHVRQISSCQTNSRLIHSLVCLSVLLVANTSFSASVHIGGRIGPHGIVLYELGGLNANAMRDGEVYRLFWYEKRHTYCVRCCVCCWRSLLLLCVGLHGCIRDGCTSASTFCMC